MANTRICNMKKLGGAPKGLPHFTDEQKLFIRDVVAGWSGEVVELKAKIAALEAELKEANDNIPKIQSLAYEHGYIAGQGYKG
jgi:hypothetical protein